MKKEKEKRKEKKKEKKRKKKKKRKEKEKKKRKNSTLLRHACTFLIPIPSSRSDLTGSVVILEAAAVVAWTSSLLLPIIISFAP
jgi:hypothetical protein